MQTTNSYPWITVSLFSLLLVNFAQATPCTDQGGRLQEGHCMCGDAQFNPGTHHCIDGTLYPGHFRSCSVCTEGIIAGKLTVSCSAGHETEEGECLKLLVNASAHSPQDIKDVNENGLPCPKGGCAGKIRVEDVKSILGTRDKCIEDLEKRLDSTKEECATAPRGAAASAPKDPHVIAVREFKSKVESAFNLCCPGVNPKGEKCGGILDQIQGCNAATCESCRSTFCYLCLERQADSVVAHAHVRDTHSGNYWEWRDGHTGVHAPGQAYTEVEAYDVTENDPMHPGQKRTRRVEVPYTYKDRYHWQLIRKKLESLFQEEKDEGVKKEVLKQIEPLLRRNKLWPLPFAKDNWIEKVMKDQQIDQRNKIALLQNEYIHQNKFATQSSSSASSSAAAAGATDTVSTQARERAEAIAAKLKELKAPVLVSLDIQRGGEGAAAGNHDVTPLLEAHEDEEIREVFARLREHAPQFFAMGGAGGNLYRIHDPQPDPAHPVADFVLSNAVPEEMNHADAVAYCRSRGAELPDEHQLRALGRAMGREQPGGYQRDRILGMNQRWFWSLSVHPLHPVTAFSFDGNDGGVYDFIRGNPNGSVRCVVPFQRGE